MRWVRRVSELLYAATHATPPPDYMRVAYQAPREVVLVTAAHGGGRNVWPQDWHMPVSIEPALYAIATTRGSYGAELIAASGKFVVHTVPATWEAAILEFGSTSGRAVDKLKGLDVTNFEGFDAPILKGALGWLACEVMDTLTVGDHELFVGRIRGQHVAGEAPRLFHVDSQVVD